MHSHFYINLNSLPAEGLGQQEKGNLFLRGNTKETFLITLMVQWVRAEGTRMKEQILYLEKTNPKRVIEVTMNFHH